MTAPRLLDLFAGEGGAALGYARAGFEVIGVERDPARAAHYPFEVIVDDALEYAYREGHRFDVIHASPPCQAYSIATAGNPTARARHVRLIDPTRSLLARLEVPYVIENVAQAHRDLRDPITLCGTQFGLTAIDTDGTPLELRRHRLFESPLPLTPPGPCRHGYYSHQVAGSYGGARRDKLEARHVRHGGYVPDKAVQAELLGIDHMTQQGLYLSLPPVYTEHLGRQIRDLL